MKKCCKGKCCCKRKNRRKKHILPILALITCFGLLAPKSIKKSLPGKALKYSLAAAWACIAVVSVLKITKVLKPKKK